jgi:hypothetical protein
MPSAGLAFLTIPDLVHDNPIADRISSYLHLAGTPPMSGPATEQLSALAGIFCMAIGIAYAINFYHGYDEWLSMSIPTRLIVSAICFALWVLAPEKVSPLLVGVGVWDGACAAVGWYLVGNCVGRKPGRNEDKQS